MEKSHKKHMMRAIELAQIGMKNNKGGPFGCVIVKDDMILAEAYNQVTSTNDPTAHAEVQAIRKACEKLGHHQLDDCIVYTSCEPCPMCLGAIYWARPAKVFFACSRDDAANINFDDQFIYDEIDLPTSERKIEFNQFLQEEGKIVFDLWSSKNDRKMY